MNHNEDVAFNSIKLASVEESYSKKTGTLIVNGGIGCNKNITTTGIISDCLLNKKSAIFNKDVIICGELKVNIIIPSDKNGPRYIGNCDNRYTSIYSNNIDTNNIYVNNTLVSTNIKTNYLTVNNSAYIGKNINNNIMLNVNDENNTITINSELLTINNNNDIAFEIDHKNIYLNNMLKLKYQNLYINDHIDLHPCASVIMINSHCDYDIKIKLCENISSVSNELLDDGTYVKIYNRSNNNIIVNNICIMSNSNADFILNDCIWIPLGYTGNGHIYKNNYYSKSDSQSDYHSESRSDYHSESHSHLNSHLDAHNSESSSHKYLQQDDNTSSNFYAESSSEFINNNIKPHNRKNICKIPSVDNLNDYYNKNNKSNTRSFSPHDTEKSIIPKTSNLNDSSSFDII